MSKVFDEIDNMLESLQNLNHWKKHIYKILAVILHLGNVEFDEIENEAQIAKTSEIHIQSITELLNISNDELRSLFLFRKIEINRVDSSPIT